MKVVSLNSNKFMFPSTCSLVLALSSISTLAFAGRNAEIKSTTPITEKPAYETLFDAAGLEKPLSVAKGDWVIKDGAVAGKEKAEDKHNAVLSLDIPKKDSVIRFSFKMAGASLFHLSLNHAKGHLFRVQVTPTGVIVNLDKDKKDDASKAIVLGKAATAFKADEWHTMQLEMKGDKIILQTDNGAKIEASNPTLNVEKKNYRFVTKGESLFIDDLKVWDVAP
jgi:co-chaperonin GroES (HSP10)